MEELRAKLHQDYDGKVLRKEVIPDPPERGQYGMAYIPLKPDAQPKRQKPYVFFGEKEEALRKITQEWIDKGYIERPTGKNCEWLSQAFAVPKKSTTFPWRGVVDMRGPNSQTASCNYPLPCIEDILVRQGKNFMFSVLDLRQAFHQQPLHPDSRPITSTITPLGIFQWKVNVMGLKNASVQFQRMMDEVLRSVADIAQCYIDDIIIGTWVEEGEDLLEKHNKYIRKVLDVLGENKLVADLTKCKFFVPEVEFCGHILGGGVRRPAPGKLLAIHKWEVPTNITELRAFLGFTNYYARYIDNYSKVVACLQEKLKVPRNEGKKGSKKAITWTEEDQKTFEELRRILSSKLELQRVNPDKPFVLRVDASKYAIGATLEQLVDEMRNPTIEDVRQQKTVPVAFMSRKLAKEQRNWVPREQETYAIIMALEKWRSWIGLQNVLVLTDHKALQEWYTEKVDTPSGPIGRRLRWHQTLSKFDLEVGYIPGKENTIADIMSRWAYPASLAEKDISKHGNERCDKEVKEIIEQERREENECASTPESSANQNAKDLQMGLATAEVAPVEGEKVPSYPKFTFAKTPRVGPRPGKRSRPVVTPEVNSPRLGR